ncbi:hypothetical protein GS580_16640 [Rhodococcus hoagii]|nr:hypothetical protein [Prescottella equi]
MKRSDITDTEVVQACRDAPATGMSSLALLMARTGAPAKVAVAAMERADARRLIDCGVSIAYAWPNQDIDDRPIEWDPPSIWKHDCDNANPKDHQ